MAIIEQIKGTLEREKHAPGQGTHDEAVQALEDALRSQRWQVEEEPLIGTVRPDLVATDPNGTSYVFEVKAEAAEAHLGAVAQVEAYRDSLRQQLGREARGVLVLVADAPKELDDVARAAGVTVWRASPDDPDALEQLPSSLMARRGSAG